VRVPAEVGARWAVPGRTPSRRFDETGFGLRAEDGAGRTAYGRSVDMISCAGLTKRYGGTVAVGGLGLRDRLHAVVYAYENRLITPG
jgi:hypothetical protein